MFQAISAELHRVMPAASSAELIDVVAEDAVVVEEILGEHQPTSCRENFVYDQACCTREGFASCANGKLEVSDEACLPDSDPTYHSYICKASNIASCDYQAPTAWGYFTGPSTTVQMNGIGQQETRSWRTLGSLHHIR